MSDVSRVGYLLKKFPRLSETFVLNEILELERQGLDVHVLSLYPPDEGRFHAMVGRLKNPITYVPEMSFRECFAFLMRRRRALEPMLGQLGTALDYVLGLGEEQGVPVMKRALSAALEVERLGITHLHAHFATIAARTALAVKQLCGTSFSVTAHAKDIYRHGVKPAEFARLVDESEFLVTVCDANRDYILSRLAPVAERPDRALKVRRLYNGVDLTLFKPQPGPAHGASANPKILAVGRLVRKKGFHVLIEACAELAAGAIRFECDIVGDGEERERLAELISRQGLDDRVRLLGALPQERLLPLYREAAVSVLPCVTDVEGNKDALPTSLLESLACGLSVVSTPVGGVEEIVDDGVNGTIVPENDSVALASAIERALIDRALRERHGRAGREKASARFDIVRNVGDLRRMFLSVLAGNMPAASRSPAVAESVV